MVYGLKINSEADESNRTKVKFRRHLRFFIIGTKQAIVNQPQIFLCGELIFSSQPFQCCFIQSYLIGNGFAIGKKPGRTKCYYGL